MFCPKCGQSYSDSAQYCFSCGVPLTATPPEAPSASEEARTPADPDVWESPAAPTQPPATPTESPSYSGAGDESAPLQPTEYRPPMSAIPVNLPPPSNYSGPPTEPLPYSGMPTAPINPTMYGAALAPCRVCGTTLAPNSYQCPRCGAPVGTVVNPNDPTSASYLRVGYAPMENTSGMKTTVPPELQGGWNWAAAFLTLFWCLGNRVWWYPIFWLVFNVFGFAIGFASGFSREPGLSIAYVGFAIVNWIAGLTILIYMGIKGNSLAWLNRRFDSIEQFRKVQRIWAWWTLGVYLTFFGLLAVLFLLIIFAAAASSH